MKGIRVVVAAFVLVTVDLWGGGVSAYGQRPKENPPAQPTNESKDVSSTDTDREGPRQGWSYNPDAGLLYQQDDLKLRIWGYGEPLFNVDGPDRWRRVRQGTALDLPRFTKHYRAAVVYEVDFTNNDFFRVGRKGKVFELLYFAVQDADDSRKFRIVVGESTHILTREENLSSGNLPTINRSLILQEHGSINCLVADFGVQVRKALSPHYTVGLSATDNRGSLNKENPRYVVGNSLAMKLTAFPIADEKRGRKLEWGAGVDHTRDIRNQIFTLGSAIGSAPLGGTLASGNKLTFEGEIAYTARVGNHPYTAESEWLFSNFSQSKTNVGGGYCMLQVSLFDKPDAGDLDPFVRYDLVRLWRPPIAGTTVQQALRTGINYNLPLTRKLVNFHVEYARNRVIGPVSIVSTNRSFNEFRIELRFNATRYVRH